MSGDWKAYVASAQRKCEITSYFAQRLATTITEVEDHTEVPPIPVQAYFEGVVISSMAAVDQIAQAVNSALRLGLRSDQLVQSAFEKVGVLLPEVKAWFDDSLGVDLRRIRTVWFTTRT